MWELACSDVYKTGRHVFISAHADRVLDHISGQAWTEIMTVRSGSARLCHCSYRHRYTWQTHACTLPTTFCLVCYYDSGPELGASSTNT